MPICPKCRGENPELGAKCPRDGYYYIHDDAIEDAQQDEWIGKLAADKYVILSLISEGGMGAVYRAMQLPVQREVAFKVLRAELQDSDQGHDRFAREARAVSQLSHPNIITMHDFGVDSNGHPFMAMEYAPGKSLASWIMQPGLKMERIAHVFRQILSALSEAHNQGIVHRDLKPENLIVTRTGADEDYIKLLDFGIARMVHDGATRGLTKEGEVFGTPHYMAPEQAQGRKDIGPPADVYALGIMLFEMLVGECPFDAPTPLSILYMHINDDLPELDARTGIVVPAAVHEVVARATAKQASERYSDAGEMLAAFDAAMGNTSGKYIAPAGTSSDRINATQNMGSQQYVQPESAQPESVEQDIVQKATADTLHFDDESAQHITGSSNAVPINDPEEKNNTTFELEALGSSGAQKALMAGAVLAVLLGLGVAFAFIGGDSGRVDAGSVDTTEKTTGDNSQQVERKEQAEQKEQEKAAVVAPAKQAPGDNEDLEAAAPDPTNPGEALPAEKPAGDEDNSASANTNTASTGSKTGSNSGDSVNPTTAAVGSKKTTSASTGSKTRRSETPPENSPTGTPDKNPSSSASAEHAKEDDAPKKFQPRKFEPKTDSKDDEPEKFEPRKWR